MKVKCRKCGLLKSLEDYPKHKRYKTGRQSKCKKCYNEYIKEYRNRNPEKVKEAQSLYYLNNREQILEHQRERYEANPEPKRKRMKIYNKNKVKKNE